MNGSLSDIRNIFCVGRNYVLHAAELGNAVPGEPMFFSKPTHALALLSGGDIRLPAGRGEVHFETELVIRIGRRYEHGIAVDDLADGVALGLDLTLRDVQSELKKNGYPWLAAKGFLGSAPVTAFRPFPGLASLAAADFGLLRNGQEAQRGNIRDMVFDIPTLIDYCAERFGIGPGDLLFTGTPAGVGPVSDGDRLQLYYADEVWGEGVVRLVR